VTENFPQLSRHGLTGSDFAAPDVRRNFPLVDGHLGGLDHVLDNLAASVDALAAERKLAPEDRRARLVDLGAKARRTIEDAERRALGRIDAAGDTTATASAARDLVRNNSATARRAVDKIAGREPNERLPVRGLGPRGGGS
jgi:hypothetical protein